MSRDVARAVMILAVVIVDILSLLEVPATTSVHRKYVQLGPQQENTTKYLGNAYRSSQSVDVSYLSFGRAKSMVDEQIRDFWKKHSKGEGIRVAILDSGVEASQLDTLRVIRMMDWTDDRDNMDYLGHGTHIASILASTDKDCPGVAPAVELLVHKILNRNSLTYTSWILDALNDVLLWNVHFVCMSIGGSDHQDQPLIDKIREVVAHGVVFLSAAGNDGPSFGTHSHPSSMKEVISVGAVDGRKKKVASFSSRGMTLEEQQRSNVAASDSSLFTNNHSNIIDDLSVEQFLDYAQVVGRPKPDVMIEAVAIASSGLKGKSKGCIGVSGTSYGVPVLAGYLSLLVSAIPVEYRLTYMNLAGIRLILRECCIPLSNSSIYEQGMGLFHFVLAKEKIFAKLGMSYPSRSRSSASLLNPRSTDVVTREFLGAEASVFPFQISLNTSYESCAFWWPYCVFDSYGEAVVPLSIKLSLVVSFPFSPSFSVESIEYVSEYGENPVWDLHATSSFWPFVGIVTCFISFPNTTASKDTSLFGSHNKRRMKGYFYIGLSSNVVPMKLSTRVHLDWCIDKQEKRKIILWDSFHQIFYPIPFVPNDDLEHPQILDKFGDLPFTNFRSLYQRFTSGPFDMKTFSYSWTRLEKLWNDKVVDDSIVSLFCVDPEDWFDEAELDAMERLVYNHGLNLVLIAEWFNEETLHDLRFWDTSTSRWWFPVVGGTNMQAVNQLGKRFGFAFGDIVFDATLCTSYYDDRMPSFSEEPLLCNGTHSVRYLSGNALFFVQQGSQVLFAHNKRDIRRIRNSALLSQEESNSDIQTASDVSQEHANLEPFDCEAVFGEDIPVFLYRKYGKGNIIVYGDSNCLDSSLSEELSSCVEDLYQVLVHLVTSKVNLSRIFPHIRYIDRNTCFPSTGTSHMNTWNSTLLAPHSFWQQH